MTVNCSIDLYGVLTCDSMILACLACSVSSGCTASLGFTSEAVVPDSSPTSEVFMMGPEMIGLDSC